MERSGVERKVAGATQVVERPFTGRVFDATRRVRFGDADARGHVRLDALARYIQDVAGDDTSEAGAAHAGATWVVRRCLMSIAQPPRAWEQLAIATWCGGVGSHWAERVVTFTGERGGDVRTASIWVAVDAAALRPARVPAGFVETYAPAAQGRRVTAALLLPAWPDDGARSARWAVRYADIDVLGHANNSVGWAMLEEAVARSGRRPARASRDAPVRAELEFREPVMGSDEITLRWLVEDDHLDVWAIASADGERSCRIAGRIGPLAPT